jgi:arylsulfatase A-like enzyme
MKTYIKYKLAFILLLMVITGSCNFHDKPSCDAENKPNIILFLCDDLGYGDISLNGQENFSTPNIDKLAEDGITFTDFYAGCTVCAPSRVSLLTGKHTGHTSVRNWKHGLRVGDNEMTLGSIMKDAGYTTAQIGKWDCGHPVPVDDPRRKGFDYFYGYLNSWHAHNFYPEFLYRNGEKVELRNKLRLNKNGENPWKHMPEGPGVAEVKMDYVPSLIDREGLQFIEENRDTSFFMVMSYNTPHANLQSKPDGMEVLSYGQFEGKEWPDPEKGFAAMIYNLDQSVAKIMDKLKEHGIDDNTMFIFCSDNGPHNQGGHKVEFFNSNGDLRGAKVDLYEGGIRTPFIIRWPNVIKPGRESGHIGAFWDVLPTLADIVNTDVPEDIDGISFLPVLQGRDKQQKKHKYLYWELNAVGGKQAIRKNNWKVVKLNVSSDKPVKIELYNLDSDPGETNNVADSYPGILEEILPLFNEAHDDLSGNFIFQSE